MTELGSFLRRLTSKEVSSPIEPVISLNHTHINPVTEPDLARKEAFLIPGAVRGQIVTQTQEGVVILDFDIRGEDNRPTRTFQPGVVHPNPDIDTTK